MSKQQNKENDDVMREHIRWVEGTIWTCSTELYLVLLSTQLEEDWKLHFLDGQFCRLNSAT